MFSPKVGALGDIDIGIDIEKCERCGGHVKVVSYIEDPEVIEKILQHLALKDSSPLPRVHEARGPPDQAVLFQL